MVETEFSKPAAGLEEFVRFYAHRQLQIDSGVIVHPVPARSTPMIEFDFEDPVNVLLLEKGVRQESPPAVVVGPQTYRRVEMELQGKLCSFTIMFQPDGLRRLFLLPMQDLVDKAEDAHSVLGSRVSELWQVLGNLTSFEARVRVVNKFLLQQAACSLGADTMSKALTCLVQAGGCSDIRVLAHEAGMSARHFARRFVEHAGVSPKPFAKIVRFQAALEAKALSTGKSWTEIAHHFGYYDQMHMVHDFQQVAGGSPKEMLAHLETVFVEPIRQFRSNAITAAAVSNARLTL